MSCTTLMQINFWYIRLDLTFNLKTMYMMRKIGIIAGVAATLLFAASCQQPCPEAPVVEALNMDSVRAEISAMEAEYQRASAAKDIEAVLAYYAEDAQSFPPMKPALVGKEAIRAHMIANQDTTSTNTETFTLEELWAEGNLAVERGTYESKNAAGEVVSRGRYFSVFEKRDGKYLCIRDIWNSEMPKPEATPAP